MNDEIKDFIADEEKIIPDFLMHALNSAPMECSSSRGTNSSSCVYIFYEWLNEIGLLLLWWWVGR